MCSIQLNFTSIIIPRYLAEYTLVIEALSMTKSLQLALFNLALWKIICWILASHIEKSVQH